MNQHNPGRFRDLALHSALFQALDEAGYVSPSPIQTQTIPLLLDGRDLLGQAQTGTGKTAAFALPLLSRLDLTLAAPQGLVLAPTRELAVQVAEAFRRYATHLPGFRVLPIYGGQDYGGQIRALRQGVHVVVGTPGRVMDHMRRGTLKLDQLHSLVLDEADEMLRMGFIDDVEWILAQAPAERQIALFSATMPVAIRRIAAAYLREPAEVRIQQQGATASTIRQRYWPISGMHKLDALTRLLEVEPFDGMIVFVRTRSATVDLAEKLSARGFAAAALNGDVPQQQRERTVERLKQGDLSILIATDVAARGLDVERVSHVINYDMPHDTEAYVHRIGRTGRAGREGQAILFVAPRERRMLQSIERAIGRSLEQMKLPTVVEINTRRVERFHERIGEALGNAALPTFRTLVESYSQSGEQDPLDIAAALALLMQEGRPLLLDEKPPARPKRRTESSNRPERQDDRASRIPTEREMGAPEAGKERYRLEVGHRHKVKPGNIVGAIANEAELDSKHIGRICIYEDHSLIDLPEGMPRETFQHLQTTRVAGQILRLSLVVGDVGSGMIREPGNGDKTGKPVKPGKIRKAPVMARAPRVSRKSQQQ